MRAAALARSCLLSCFRLGRHCCCDIDRNGSLDDGGPGRRTVIAIIAVDGDVVVMRYPSTIAVITHTPQCR